MIRRRIPVFPSVPPHYLSAANGAAALNLKQERFVVLKRPLAGVSPRIAEKTRVADHKIERFVRMTEAPDIWRDI